MNRKLQPCLLILALLASLVTSLLPAANTLAAPAASSTLDALGVNAIENPGAESGMYYWDDYDYLSTKNYDYSHVPKTSDPGPQIRGDALFWGSVSFGQPSIAKQTIYLSSTVDNSIEEGFVRYDLSAYLGGYGTEQDHAKLTAKFLDSSGTTLRTAELGPVTAAERDNKTGLFYRSASGMVPQQTYSIEVTLTFTDVTRDWNNDYNHGYADNLSLVLRHNGIYLPCLYRPETPPTAPSGLWLTPVSQAGIDVRWTDNSNNESGFEIERAPYGSSTFSRIGTTGANVTLHQDRGLAAGTGYTYRVRAVGPGGASGYSPSANATTFPNAPAAPSGLAASNITHNSTRLTWVDHANNETGFELEMSVNGGAFSLLAGTSALPANTAQYTAQSLQPGTNYQFRLRARNQGGVSAYSNTVTIRTLTVQTTLRVTNNNSWYFIVSLKIDGVEKLPTWGNAISPGDSRDYTITAGTHTVIATTGFWNTDTNQRIDRYIWTYSVTAQAGETKTIQVNDPSIQQLMTNFSDRMYWEGFYWTDWQYLAGFCFYSNGRYRLYDRGIQIEYGTYRLKSFGDTSTRFEVDDDNLTINYEGLLATEAGYFYMNNGPASWEQITYYQKGANITAQKCPVSAP